LKQIEAIFAISVGGFSTMDNHFHLLLRVDPNIARDWSDQEVATRWLMLYLARDV
jgi:putative transposase